MTNVRFDQAVVDDYLEAAHEVGNHLLATFHEVCTELGIPYFLTSGTLLGAVRSGDWIPWDDDVDVMMFREDYERLVPLIQDRLPDNVAVQLAGDARRTTSPSSRGCSTSTAIACTSAGTARSVPIETKHVPLDIFILDEGPRNARLRKAWSLTAHGHREGRGRALHLGPRRPRRDRDRPGPQGRRAGRRRPVARHVARRRWQRPARAVHPAARGAATPASTSR